MDLVRNILLKLEVDYSNNAIYNLTIEGYRSDEIAYHCKLMYDANLIDSYYAQNADDKLYLFTVGGLTWAGQDYLEVIRNDDVWVKTKQMVEEKKLPKTIEFIAKIAGRFAGAMLDEMN